MNFARKYVETHDDKKIVEELYELVRELEKLKNELIGLETQGLAPGSRPRIWRLGYSERANHDGLAKCRLGFSWISIWRHCVAVDLDIHRAELRPKSRVNAEFDWNNEKTFKSKKGLQP